MRLDTSCPFCGNDDIPIRQFSSNDGPRFVALCNKCGARGPGAKSSASARDRWQLRTPKPIWMRLEEEGKVAMETNPFEQIVEDHDLLCPRCGVPPLLKKVHNMWVVQCLSCGRKTTDIARYLAEADGWVNTGKRDAR